MSKNEQPWLEQPRQSWKARWIWLPDDRTAQRNRYALFRREFESGPARITVDVSADSFYWLYLDGRFIARGPSRAHLDFYTFDTFGLELTAGRHCLAVMGHHIGEPNATIMTGRPALLVEASLDGNDGSSGDLSSGPEWLSIEAAAWRREFPEKMSHFGFPEECDLRKLPCGWSQPGFDSSGWEPARIVGIPPCAPWTSLAPRDIPQPELTRVDPVVCVGNGNWAGGSQEALPSKTVASRKRVFSPEPIEIPWRGTLDSPVGAPFLVLDFGRCLSGYVELEFGSSVAGQSLEISYDDLLAPEGGINPERSYAHLSDRFLLPGGGFQLRTAHPRGFRFLMLDFSGPGDLDLLRVSAIEETYPFRLRKAFFSEDPWLQGIYAKSAETLRVCTTDAFTDCASRERVQWTQDIYLANRVAFYAFGDTRMMRRALFQAAQNALPDGRINGFFPSERTNCAFASSSLFWIHQLVDYLEFANPDDLPRLFPTAQRLLVFLESLQDADGLISDWPSGQFWDWAPIEGTGCLLITNAVYLHALARMAAHPIFLEHLKTPGFSHLPRLRQAAHARFWDPDREFYRDAVPVPDESPIYSQQANTMAVLSGICPAPGAGPLLRRIIDPKVLGPLPVGEQLIEPQNRPSPDKLVPVGTLWFAHFLCEALFEADMPREALEQMRQIWGTYDDLPNLPETRIQHGNTTLCHAWSAGPAYLLPKYLQPIQPSVSAPSSKPPPLIPPILKGLSGSCQLERCSPQ